MGTDVLVTDRIEFTRKLLPKSKRKLPPAIDADMPFGRIRTNHMVISEYRHDGGGWQKPRVEPVRDFHVPPDALVFHYGQQIFEGLKAYRSKSDPAVVNLFRPEINAARFAGSANILGMRPVPEELFLAAVQEMVRVDQEFVLPHPCMLYLRPTLLPLDVGLSVRSSLDYVFFVIASPVKEYFGSETGVLVTVERERVRAYPGGVGEAKCGGNYAGSLSALMKAKEMGAHQVLWLDGREHRYIEEVGAMNAMFVYENRLVTPALSGSILHGVTRNSLLELARARGLVVEETRLAIDDVLADAQSGKLLEAFVCGTAAVVTPVRAFLDRGREVPVRRDTFGQLAFALKQELSDIQFGVGEDPHGFRVGVPL